MGKKGRKHKVGRQGLSPRERVLESLPTLANTEKWLRSTNPVKKRIASLERVWRGGLDWLLNDIQKMFTNIELLAEGHDNIDLNVAALKSLMVDKGVITEEEFAERRQKLFAITQKKRMKMLEEARRAEEEAERVKEAEEKAHDGSAVTPELPRMRKAAEDASGHVPPEAFEFGG